MTYAVYRVLYGEDFMEASIKSIVEYVDKIFIFKDDKPWGDVEKVIYKGHEYKIPIPVDNTDNIINYWQSIFPIKITVIKDHVVNNENQFTHLVNKYILSKGKNPSKILFIEPDHVFTKSQAEKLFSSDVSGLCYGTRQIELWRNTRYRVPERSGRLSCIMWNTKDLKEIPKTGRHANPIDYKIPMIDVFVHNLGFCMSEKNMFIKFLLSLGFSKIIGDSAPNFGWYDKWLTWEPSVKNLEISEGFEDTIPYAIPYVDPLPETL